LFKQQKARKPRFAGFFIACLLVKAGLSCCDYDNFSPVTLFSK